MPAVMVGGALGVFAYASGNAIFANYLLIPHVPGVGEMLIFCSTLAEATFWPTIMIESRTSCRKVCATQPTIVTTLPVLMADGSEIRAMIAKR